jgi:hypothetical protein
LVDFIFDGTDIPEDGELVEVVGFEESIFEEKIFDESDVRVAFEEISVVAWSGRLLFDVTCEWDKFEEADVVDSSITFTKKTRLYETLSWRVRFLSSILDLKETMCLYESALETIERSELADCFLFTGSLSVFTGGFKYMLTILFERISTAFSWGTLGFRRGGFFSEGVVLRRVLISRMSFLTA